MSLREKEYYLLDLVLWLLHINFKFSHSTKLVSHQQNKIDLEIPFDHWKDCAASKAGIKLCYTWKWDGRKAISAEVSGKRPYKELDLNTQSENHISNTDLAADTQWRCYFIS